jgi:hypothetical protein
VTLPDLPNIPSPPLVSDICQRDDGRWAIGFHDDAPGPFPTRNFAHAVWLRQTRHSNRLAAVVTATANRRADSAP